MEHTSQQAEVRFDHLSKVLIDLTEAAGLEAGHKGPGACICMRHARLSCKLSLDQLTHQPQPVLLSLPADPDLLCQV